MPDLTQAQANSLMEAHKLLIDNSPLVLPNCNFKIQRDLVTKDTRQSLILDLSDKSYKMVFKFTQNERWGSEILLRLDIGGPPHQNPEGVVVENGCIRFVPDAPAEKILTSHLHVFSDVYGDRIAIPCDQVDGFNSNFDVPNLVLFFCNRCNIMSIPRIEVSTGSLA